MHSLKLHSIRVAVLLIAGVMLMAGRAPGSEEEAKLIGVLKSVADQKAKADACMALARFGSKDAVPTLAALLTDEKLSHMARYALEPIPDPSVDEALREALPKVKGRLLTGVIGSLGVRHDSKAVEPIAALLQDSDAQVAQAAARALGMMTTPEAVKALEAAQAKTPAAHQVSFCEGLLRGAEALEKGGKTGEAQKVYDRLRAQKELAYQIRTAALRGAVLTRQEAGLPILLEALRGEDYAMVEAAARTAVEMPGGAVTKALADELSQLPVEKQILVTQVLGKCGDPAAGAALAALVKNGEPAARTAALLAIPEVGGADAVGVLLSLFGDAEVGAIAREALAAASGKEVDTAILGMLDDKDPKTRGLAIDLLGRRRVEGALPKLLKAAEDADESVRVAAIKALGTMAGQAEFAALVDLTLKAQTPGELQAYENTLGAISTREARLTPGDVVVKKALYGDVPDGKSVDVSRKVMELIKSGTFNIEASNEGFGGDPAPGVEKRFLLEYQVGGVGDIKTAKEGETITLSGGVSPAACVDPLCAAVAKASKEPKLALLRVMRTSRGPKVLDAVRAAAKDADADVRATAIGVLCDWTVEALPDIRELLKSATDAKTTILALRGCLRLIPQQSLPIDKKLEELKEVMAKVERPEEKRLGLAALGAIPSAESLTVVMASVGDPAVKNEACLAAMAIAEKIVANNAAQVAAAMEQVQGVVKGKTAKTRVQELLDQARKGK